VLAKAYSLSPWSQATKDRYLCMKEGCSGSAVSKT
jgi:hypothetical protein